MLRINTNVAALNTSRTLKSTDVGLSRSLERLSSGLRINRASDDAAGLSISETLRAQVRGSQRAGQNIQDGISLINVAEGALNEVHDILQRMETLAVQASNGTLAPADRNAVQAEFQALQAEIGNIASYTSFNGVELFTGIAGSFATGGFNTNLAVPSNVGTTSFTLVGPPPPLSPSALNSLNITATSTAYAGAPGPPVVAPIPSVATTLTPADYTVTAVQQGVNGTTPLFSYNVQINNTALAGTGPYNVTAAANMTYPSSTLPLPITVQSGANNGQIETILVPPVNSSAIGVGSASVSTQGAAMLAIANVQSAIAAVSTMRSGLGASSNSLEHAFSAVAIAAENQSAAESRIRDADMAADMTSLTRQQILMQSSMGMLSIANDNRLVAQLFS